MNLHGTLRPTNARRAEQLEGSEFLSSTPAQCVCGYPMPNQTYVRSNATLPLQPNWTISALKDPHPNIAIAKSDRHPW